MGVSAVPLPARAQGFCPAITRLTLTHFRNYAQARLECAAQPIVLYGANGAGKTNILEALSLLAPGRGLHRARLEECRTHNSASADFAASFAPDFAIAAELLLPTGTEMLGTGSENGEKRLYRVNGAAASGDALAELVAFSWLTPDMDRLLAESAGTRRRFLDRLVAGFAPAHHGRLHRYEKAQRERQALLAQMRPDPQWLSALEQVMAENAVAIAAARQEFLQLLQEATLLGGVYFPAVGLSLLCALDKALQHMPALAAEEWLRQEWQQQRALDAQSTHTQTGPHKTEFLAELLPQHIAAQHASSGQLKAMMLSLLLAQARLVQQKRGLPPILLLDEAMAHLDGLRREALADALLALQTQIWLTGTDKEQFLPFSGAASFVAVAEGRLFPNE